MKQNNYLWLNILDEKHRFVRLELHPAKQNEQLDSHTISYLYARDMYKEYDEEKIGLEECLTDSQQ